MLPDGYAMRPLELTDTAALAAAYTRNRAHLEEWDPRRNESFFTEQGQAAAVAGQLAAVEVGQNLAWVLTCGDEIVGRVNLNNIVMGVLRSGSLGYWVAEAHTRRGLASAAVAHAVDRALERGLHRVDAGTLLRNKASQAVLLRNGFEQYGVAPKFLFIDGRWQDHNLYQRILHDDPPA
ncbi:MAG: GNAT family N-acetyltransferase [Nocardioidaceae bacterium]